MIDIVNREYKPDIQEISDFIKSPLFNEMCERLGDEFKALYSIDYSGDKVLLGWNIRFYKGSRTLCRLYPKEHYFKVLVVVGRKEKERVEKMLPDMSKELRLIYEGTQEGMGQRWLVYDLRENDELYKDTMSLVKIRKESK